MLSFWKSLESLLTPKTNMETSTIFGLKKTKAKVLPLASYRTICKAIKTSDHSFLTYKMRLMLATSIAVTMMINERLYETSL